MITTPTARRGEDPPPPLHYTVGKGKHRSCYTIAVKINLFFEGSCSGSGDDFSPKPSAHACATAIKLLWCGVNLNFPLHPVFVEFTHAQKIAP